VLAIVALVAVAILLLAAGAVSFAKPNIEKVYDPSDLVAVTMQTVSISRR
jgi:hypothetical protein